MSEVGLPIGWRRASLASLASYVNGFAFNDQFWSEKGLPIVRIAQITGSQPVVDRFDGQLPSQYRLDDGDLIFSWSGTLAVVRWHGGPAWLNQHLFKVEPRGDVDSNLLFHLLQRSVAEMDKRSHGSTMKHIKRGELAEYEIVLPKDLDEQAALAKVLDTLDTTIRQTETIIEKLKQVKQGLLHDLLTRGIDANGELRPPQSEAPHLYKASPLGWIPCEWAASSLDSACADVVDCPHSTPAFSNEGVLVARTMHIKDGRFLEHIASRVSEAEYAKRIQRLTPKPGDVVFTREAPVGEAFVIPDGMRICLGQRVMLLRPSPDKLLGSFLTAQIYSGVVADRISALTAGTTNPHLNVSEVRQFILPLPPFSEQVEIDARLNGLERRIRAEASELEKLAVLKSGLMDDLLTGRVRVTPLLTQPTTT